MIRSDCSIPQNSIKSPPEPAVINILPPLPRLFSSMFILTLPPPPAIISVYNLFSYKFSSFSFFNIHYLNGKKKSVKSADMVALKGG